MSKQTDILESLKKVHEDIFDEMGSETEGDKENLVTGKEFAELEKFSPQDQKEFITYLKSSKAEFFKGQWQYNKSRNEYILTVKHGYFFISNLIAGGSISTEIGFQSNKNTKATLMSLVDSRVSGNLDEMKKKLAEKKKVIDDFYNRVFGITQPHWHNLTQFKFDGEK